MQDAKKSPKIAICAESHRTILSGYIFTIKARIDNRKKLVKQQYLLHMSPQYGELGPLATKIVSLVWGTPGNFNGFCFLAALLHGILVVGISQTLRCWTEGATYIVIYILICGIILAIISDWLLAFKGQKIWLVHRNVVDKLTAGSKSKFSPVFEYLWCSLPDICLSVLYSIL